MKGIPYDITYKIIGAMLGDEETYQSLLAIKILAKLDEIPSQLWF